MPRGTPAGKPSEQTQRLLDALADIEERLKGERKKDTGRALLLRFVDKHQLTAADLREAARNMAAREVGDTPAVSQHIGKAKRVAMGRALRKAREAKGINATGLGKLIGAKGTAAVSQWENGMLPSKQQYRDALTKHLDLPKDFFDEMPLNKRGQHGNQPKGKAKAKGNGAAVHA